MLFSHENYELQGRVHRKIEFKSFAWQLLEIFERFFEATLVRNTALTLNPFTGRKLYSCN